MGESGLQAEAQAPIPVMLRGRSVGEYRADVLVNDTVILELKAVPTPTSEHYEQVLHYLRATEIEVALLLNFGSRPSFKRFLFDNASKGIRVNPRKSVAKW